MAKKKVARKRVSSSKSRTVSRSSRSSRISSNKSVGNRLSLAWANFVFFLIIFVVSLVLYQIVPNILLQNFFGVISVISGIVAAALLIAAIVLSILRFGRK